MMSLDELQISFHLFFVPKVRLMTSYPETLTMKKLIKMSYFTIEIYYINFFLEWPKNYTYKKSYLGYK
jgi:hypothetical protein